MDRRPVRVADRAATGCYQLSVMLRAEVRVDGAKERDKSRACHPDLDFSPTSAPPNRTSQWEQANTAACPPTTYKVAVAAPSCIVGLCLIDDFSRFYVCSDQFGSATTSP